MSNLIQIKRSTTASAPPSLANGELAFTSNGDVLFIGSPNGSIVAIGGARFPGVLTANQALVANTTSGIDKLIVANLYPTQVYANGGFGTSGQVLSSNGSSLYWQTLQPGVTGSNQQIQFNSSGTLGADAGLTYNVDTDTLNVTSTILTTSVNAASYTIGSDLVANSEGAFLTGRVNAAALSVGNSVVANGTGVWTTGTVNAATISVGTSVSANSSRLVIGSGVGLQANGALGTSGQVLASNGSSVYWADAGGTGTVTSVASGNGLSGGPITTTGTLSVLAGDGVVSNSTGVYVRAGTGVTVNATGVHIGQSVGTADSVTFAGLTTTGNTKLGDAATDVVTFVGRANSDFVPSANLTYNIGSTDNRWNAAFVGNVQASYAYVSGNLELGGDLVVNGNLVTQNVSSIIVSDPLIYLAGNNYSSDLVDIGFVGNYNDGVDNRHAGLFRHASNKEFYVFDGYLPEPNTNIIDVSNASFKVATLNAYLKSGGLATNSTAVAITANSTVSVSITANSISLGTALAGTSGGTGKGTVSNNALLVGNSTNGYNELALGTAGYVLQSNGTSLVYDTLDGGSF